MATHCHGFLISPSDCAKVVIICLSRTRTMSAVRLADDFFTRRNLGNTRQAASAGCKRRIDGTIISP